MTLMVTLIVLMAITIIGVAALRGSSLNLIAASNSKWRMKLVEASDSGIRMAEKQVSELGIDAFSSTGLLGGASGKESVWCLGRTTANEAELRNNVCDVDVALDFMSGDQSTVVQTALLRGGDAEAPMGVGLIEGQDQRDDDAGGQALVEVYSTSVMPEVGSASTSDIEDCLAKPNSDALNASAVTVTDCLASAGATFTTTVEVYCAGTTCNPSK